MKSIQITQLNLTKTYSLWKNDYETVETLILNIASNTHLNNNKT
jgi:hypothetical protein